MSTLVHKINNHILPLIQAVELIQENLEDKELCQNLCTEILKDKETLTSLISELKSQIRGHSEN